MRKSHNESDEGRPGLPLVVQLSFAGSRMLFDHKRHPRIDRAAFEQEVQRSLVNRISELHTELELTDRHFWCGISQVAIGGDTVFTRACQDLQIPQRIFLPQHREDFLAAQAKNGQHDFSVQEQQGARDLLSSPHIIHEQVVAHSADRQERFEEVNRELARAADVIICLVRDDATVKPGGSLDLVEQARRRRRPVLEIRVGVGPNGSAVFSETWRHREFFKRPTLPHELAGLQADLEGIPPVKPYCEALKGFASAEAHAKRRFFKYSALMIVGTHFLATLFAVLALVDHKSRAVPWLLGAELVLLFVGLATHQLLHQRHATAVWGMSRLVAEIGRSVLPMASVPTYLSHLFTLPMPETLRSLLRTLNVLHLRESREISLNTLPERRRTYIEDRLMDQIKYYDQGTSRARHWLRVATTVFLAGSLSAFAATSFKLFLVLHEGPVFDLGDDLQELLTHGLGALAILLPVVAVASLSLAASLDLHARASTYREMLDFLKEHRERTSEATSEREFAELAIESETRLLGETVTWYFRRSYTSVA
jgi:hypothetical protein